MALSREGAGLGRSLFLLLHAVGLLQLLLLPLSPSLYWRAPGAEGNAVAGFLSFLEAVAFLPWVGPGGTRGYPPSTMFIFAAAYAGVATLLFLRLTVAPQAAARMEKQVLRLQLHLALTLGVLPLLANLLSPLSCKKEWDTGYPCWQGGHLAAAFVGALLACALLALLFLAALMLKNSALDLKANPTLQAHGRAQAGALLLRSSLAAFFVLARDITPWAHALVNVMGASMLLAAQLRYLDYFDQAINRALCAFHAIYLAAGVACVLCVGLYSNSGVPSSVTGAALVWAFLTPMAAQAGWFAAATRWRLVGASKDLSSPYIVELRVRHLLTEGKQLGGGMAGWASAGAPAAGAGVSELRAPPIPAGHPGVPPGTDATLCPVVGGAGESLRGGAGDGDGDAADRFFAPAEGSPAALVRHMDALLVEAAMTHSGSALLHIFQAIIARGVRRNVHLERMHLRAAAANAEDGALDVHFVVQQRLAVMKEDDHRSSGGKMTVELRLHFETLQAAAEAKVVRCRQLTLTYWQTLCEKVPDLTVLSTTGRRVQEAIAEAESVFKDLLTMAPTSVPVLRAYAAFALEVSNNPALAQEMLTDADTLEEEASKAHANAAELEITFGAPAELDLTADGVALVRVSARASEGGVGAILHANISAQKLFGYVGNKRELLLRDISVLLPEPIASVHHHFLARFNKDGVQHMTGSGKILFGLHRSGHLFPMRLFVYSTGDVWACAMEEIHSPGSSFLFVSGAPRQPVLASCRTALSLLGVSSALVRGGGVELGTYLSDAGAVLRALVAAGPSGGVVALRAHSGRALQRAFMRARVQEVRVPHLEAPLFIVRLRHASAADLSATALAGTALGLAPGEALPDPHAIEPAADYSGDEKKKKRMDGGGGGAEDLLFGGGAARDEKEDGSEGGGGSSANSASAMGGSSEGGREAAAGAPYVPPTPEGGKKTVAFSDEGGGAAARAPSSAASTGGSAPAPPAAKPPSALRQQPAASASLRLRTVSTKTIPTAAATLLPPPPTVADGEHLEDNNGKPRAASFADAAPLTPSAAAAKLRSGASVLSGGSSQSRFSRLSAAEMVRRGVAFRASRMEPSLVSLRNSVLTTFAIAALINILSYAVMRTSFDALITNFQTVVDCAARAVYVQRGVEQVQMQVFSNYNTSPAYPNYNFVAEVDFDFSNERIRTSVNDVERLHQKLYVEAESLGGASRAFYLNPIWRVQDLVPGSYVSRDHYETKAQNVSFMNLVIDYIAKQRSFWWYPITQVYPNDGDTFWIENNGASVLQEALNISLFQASSSSEGTSQTVSLANYVVLIVAIGVFSMVALVAIVPAINVVLGVQNDVYHVFAQVPIRVVRNLRDSLAHKILTAKAVEDSNGEDQALDMAAWDSAGAPAEGAAILGDASAASAEEAAAAAARLHTEEEAEALVGGCRGAFSRCRLAPLSGGAGAGGGSGKARPFRRAANTRFTLVSRMLLPVLFFCLYFALTFWWRQVVNVNAAFFRSEVLWGAELQVLIPSVAYALRNALTYQTPQVWVPNWVNISETQLQVAAELIDSLSYGSARLGVRPALTFSKTAYSILLENGCVHNEVPAAVCRNYGTKTCNYL